MHVRTRLVFWTEPLNRYEKGSKLAGVIYIHRISDIRFTGIAGRNFKMFRELCGDKTLRNVVLVTNMWTRDSHSNNEAREQELSSKFFKQVLDKGAQLIRHHDTAKSTHDIIRKIMVNHPLALQIQQELVDEHKGIIDTSAGQAVNRELNEQAKRHRAELEKVEKGVMQALREKDEETKQELEEQARTLQEQMVKIEKESREMAANYAAEKERMEAKMREIEEEAKKERERVEAEYKQRLADLDRRLQDADNASAADRARLEEMRRYQAELKTESEEQTRRLEEKVEKYKKDSEGMASNYAAEKAKMEALMDKLDQEAKERERVETEYRRQLIELNRRLQDTANGSTADQEKLKEEIQRVEDHVLSTPYVQVLFCLVTHDG